MDIIVLGILMMQNCTIYEMRKYIETWFTGISSNSIGSIQAAIKKLVEKDCIVFNEYLENSVNKKVYSITPQGKEYFQNKISTPMRYKEKNMELNKLFFMGFADRDKWAMLLDSYIGELHKNLELLEQISRATLPRYSFSEEELAIQRARGAADEITIERSRDIAEFQYATLDLSIEQLKFQIGWFENYKQTLQKRGKPDGDK